MLSAGLAWDFFPWKNSLVSIVDSSSGQNKDLTNSEEKMNACIFSTVKGVALCCNSLRQSAPFKRACIWSVFSWCAIVL